MFFQKVIAPFILDAQRIQDRKRGSCIIILETNYFRKPQADYNGLSGLAYEGKNL